LNDTGFYFGRGLETNEPEVLKSTAEDAHPYHAGQNFEVFKFRLPRELLSKGLPHQFFHGVDILDPKKTDLFAITPTFAASIWQGRENNLPISLWLSGFLEKMNISSVVGFVSFFPRPT
jgi:hypothetical protein